MTIQENEAVTLARFKEIVVNELQTPVPEILIESFNGVAVEENEAIHIGILTDTLMFERRIGGEILRFNQSQKERYNYSTRYIKVSETAFREQDTYVSIGVEKPIDMGLLIEVAITTDGFKTINHIDVEAI